MPALSSENQRTKRSLNDNLLRHNRERIWWATAWGKENKYEFVLIIILLRLRSLHKTDTLSLCMFPENNAHQKAEIDDVP